jgi:GDP-L-fucose synthase
MKTKILVTGGNGMLGRAIVKKLVSQSTIEIYNPTSSEMNLTSMESIESYLCNRKIDQVYHVASLVYGLQGNLSNQLKSFETNTKIYSNLLTYLADNSMVPKIFFAGTVASYPEKFLNTKLNEKDFLGGEPHTGEYGYAMAKRQALAHLKILGMVNNINFVYGVFTNLYGPNDTYDIINGHVIPSLIKKAHNSSLAGGDTVAVWGNEYSTRDFMHVDDAARAAILLMENFEGVVNICTGVESSMREVAEIIKSEFDLSGVKWETDKPVGISNRSVSNEILKSYNFHCEYDLITGLKNACNWYKSNERIV